MNPDRATILSQLSSGQITADQAAEQLRGNTPPRTLPNPGNPPPLPTPGGSLSARWLHIRVTDLTTNRPKVNVNLPLTWVQVGLKIGARYSDELAGLEWESILEDIRSGTTGKIVEVEDVDDGERVEIYVD